jgi:hypothetical protein
MAFIDELALSDPGDEIVYHKGYHCVDSVTGHRLPEAKEAWLAYVRGDVLLYQRRLGPGLLQYCARVVR